MQTLRQWAARLMTDLTHILRLDVRFYGRSLIWMSIAYSTAVLRGLATTFFFSTQSSAGSAGSISLCTSTVRSRKRVFLFWLTCGDRSWDIAQGNTIIIRDTIRLQARWTPIGSIALSLAAAYYTFFRYEVAVGGALLVAAIAFPFHSMAGLFGPILTGQERVGDLAKTSMVSNVSFSVLFFLVALSTQSIPLLILAYFGFDVIIRGFITYRLYQQIPLRGESARDQDLGRHLTAIGAMQTITGQLDQLLVNIFGGYTSLAGYSIATLIPDQMKDFLGNITGVILRRFATRDLNEKTLVATRRHFWLYFLVSGFAIALYTLSAPLVIRILFPAYIDQIPATIIYAIGLFGLASSVGVTFAQAHIQKRRLWIFYSSQSVVSVLLNSLLIPSFGAMGAVVAKTLTRLFSLGFSYPSQDRGPNRKNPS
jgi:O-antigen/teichoic acid export membrane protein